MRADLLLVFVFSAVKICVYFHILVRKVSPKSTFDLEGESLSNISGTFFHIL